MSNRFYAGQGDYILQLNLMDTDFQEALAAVGSIPQLVFDAETAATGAAQSASAASTSATNAGTSATAANNWAVSLTTFTGSGGLYGARKYANDAAGSATAAQNWSISMSLVDATYYGARKYALDAAQSAAAAAQSASQASAGQVNADWNATSGLAEILNKPNLALYQPLITAGTTDQFYRGDKTWQDLAASVRSVALAGLSTASSASLATTDTVISGFGKLQAQMHLRAPLASPALTGTPTAPTAAAGTNTTQIASTAFVRTELANLVGTVPATLDTLDELAAALGDDPNFAATMTTSLGNRLRVDINNQGLTVAQILNAKTNIGLQNVDNTADVNKPVSTAQQAALDLKANKANDTLVKPTVKGYIEQFQTLNPGAAVTVDPLGLGTVIEMTTTANLTVTLPAPVAGMSFKIIIIYGGAHTVSWAVASGTLGWTGKSTGTNTAPAPTMIAGKKDVYGFISGSNYYIGLDGGRNA